MTNSWTCRKLPTLPWLRYRGLSVSCAATDRNGKQYELQFQSDGAPIIVRRFAHTPLPTAARRAKQVAQLECRLESEVEKVLPRDRTAYIIRCLEQDKAEE